MVPAGNVDNFQEIEMGTKLTQAEKNMNSKHRSKMRSGPAQLDRNSDFLSERSAG